MALAAIFITGEGLRKGSFLLWLSFGSAASGILALLDIPVTGQIAVFINVSGILIRLERRFSERYSFKKSMNYNVNNDSLNDQSGDLYVFRKTGTGWEIKYGGISYSIKHSIGLTHIRNLIIKEGEWLHCSELKRLSSGNMNENNSQYTKMSKEQLEIENLSIGDNTRPEDIIDRLSLDKIKGLRDILIERRESDNFDSPEEKIEQLNTLEFIEKYIKSVTDNKGRPRKINNQEDTDRKAVSAAINRCRGNLQEHKELYTHFKSFIQAEGNTFRYLPDRPIDWKTE